MFPKPSNTASASSERKQAQNHKSGTVSRATSELLSANGHGAQNVPLRHSGLAGRRALVRVRATQPGAVIELDRERLLALVRLVIGTVSN